jgi:ribonuclease D
MSESIDSLLSCVSTLIAETMKATKNPNFDSKAAKTKLRAAITKIHEVEGPNAVQSFLDKARFALDATGESDDVMEVDDNNSGNGEDNVEDAKAKPQEAWSESIDNSRHIPFKPTLRTKPNATIPLKLTKIEVRDGDDASNDDIDDDDDVCGAKVGPTFVYSHPYEHELTQLTYPSWQVADASGLSVSNYRARLNDPSHPFEFVSSEDDFDRLCVELEGRCTPDRRTGIQDVREIAIDLEHHAARSFQGFTCLMQLSTREKDWVIDTIALRSDLYRLNCVFTAPHVVKVMHGCRNDVLWLQKDLGLYLVNVFDTYFASKLLAFPHLSLKYLLKRYVQVEADKQYQMCDWRQRPLSREQLRYARDDTHYLLYIYDSLRRDLCKKQPSAQRDSCPQLLEVLDESRKLCLQRYNKDAFRPRGYLKCFKDPTTGRGVRPKDAPVLKQEQQRCLDALWEWRDRVARAEDESPHWLMSNAELLAIGQAAPQTAKDVLLVYERSAAAAATAAANSMGRGRGAGLIPLKKGVAVSSLLDDVVDVLTGRETVIDTRAAEAKAHQHQNAFRRRGYVSSVLPPVSLFTSKPVKQLLPSYSDAAKRGTAMGKSKGFVESSAACEEAGWFNVSGSRRQGGNKTKSDAASGSSDKRKHGGTTPQAAKGANGGNSNSLAVLESVRERLTALLEPVHAAIAVVDSMVVEEEEEEEGGSTKRDRVAAQLDTEEEEEKEKEAEGPTAPLIFNNQEEEVISRAHKKQKHSRNSAAASAASSSSSSEPTIAFDYSTVQAQADTMSMVPGTAGAVMANPYLTAAGSASDKKKKKKGKGKDGGGNNKDGAKAGSNGTKKDGGGGGKQQQGHRAKPKEVREKVERRHVSSFTTR